MVAKKLKIQTSNINVLHCYVPGAVLGARKEVAMGDIG